MVQLHSDRYGGSSGGKKKIQILWRQKRSNAFSVFDFQTPQIKKNNNKTNELRNNINWIILIKQHIKILLIMLKKEPCEILTKTTYSNDRFVKIIPKNIVLGELIQLKSI